MSNMNNPERRKRRMATENGLRSGHVFPPKQKHHGFTAIRDFPRDSGLCADRNSSKQGKEGPSSGVIQESVGGYKSDVGRGIDCTETACAWIAGETVHKQNNPNFVAVKPTLVTDQVGAVPSQPLELKKSLRAPKKCNEVSGFELMENECLRMSILELEPGEIFERFPSKFAQLEPGEISEHCKSSFSELEPGEIFEDGPRSIPELERGIIFEHGQRLFSELEPGEIFDQDLSLFPELEPGEIFENGPNSIPELEPGEIFENGPNSFPELEPGEIFEHAQSPFSEHKPEKISEYGGKPQTELKPGNILECSPSSLGEVKSGKSLEKGQSPFLEVELIKAVSPGRPFSEHEFGDVFDKPNQRHHVNAAGLKNITSHVHLNSSSPASSVNASAGSSLNKRSTKINPPRRRISAVRDFPSYFGTTASRLNRKKCMKGTAPVQRGNLMQESFGLVEMEVMTNTEQINQDVQERCAHKCIVKGDVARQMRHKIQTESELIAAKSSWKHGKYGSHYGKETNVSQEASKRNGTSSQYGSNECWFKKTKRETQNGVVDVGYSEDKKMKNIVIYKEDKSRKRIFSDLYNLENQSQVEESINLDDVSNRKRVPRVMARPSCSWRQGKIAYKSNSVGSKGKKRVKKPNFTLLPRPRTAQLTSYSESSGKRCIDENSFASRSTYMGTSQLVIGKERGSHMHADEFKSSLVGSKYPCRPSSSAPKGDGNVTISSRKKVREALRLFQSVFRKILHEEEAKLPQCSNTHKRIDYQAARVLKEKQKFVNTGKHIIGTVPGVEIGDEFHYRVELNIIGVHRNIQSGIDYVNEGGKILATSIVSSGGYDDERDNTDVLIYMGQGGNVINKDQDPEDQKLIRGNLALANSRHAKNPVRVIFGDSSDAKVRKYIYDGLYLVDHFWQDQGPHGKLVFKFRLIRILGQPELSWKVVKKSRMSKVREGLCVKDISRGKELLPICAVNTIDDEKPPALVYITGMKYPNWFSPSAPKGCDCTSGCSESRKCSCLLKNGGEIPYNRNGAIVHAKPLVYECGPSCKCPPSCYNRVSQHGIKLQLEIFKTESRGWGVRSLNSILSGSFICEYAGELLKEKEADERIGSDEYLFDIGRNFDASFYNELSTVMPATQKTCQTVEDGGFTIDAAENGNVGRFINHSCSPNLYAQNVLYDYEDKRIPHVMLFAMGNIPPLQELTYHYNYLIDQVQDSYGNIKKKFCYCGSSECSGRMY